jgi:tyrosine-specific transport protein
MRQRVIGATLIIAGTTIGAGMLALPMTSSSIGFLKSLALLGGLWLYMILAAVFMVEINHGKGATIVTLAEKRLGPWAKRLAALSLLVLFWALLAAYISGGSSILHQGIGGAQTWIAIIYTAVLGFSVVICTKFVDYANRFLFIIKCAIFIAILIGLFPFVQISHLKATAGGPQALLSALPIFFTSFGFHGSLPTLIKYLHGDKKNIYTSIIIGSSIPLVVYILWQMVTLGVLGPGFECTGNVGIFISKLTSQTSHPYLLILADAFAFFAIATSFLGVSLGLFDYLVERFAKRVIIKKKGGRLEATIFTFALPLIFSIFYPAGFVFALGFAAIALSILAVILPSLIFIVEKKFSFFLNKWTASFMMLGGIFIIVIEVIAKCRCAC